MIVGEHLGVQPGQPIWRTQGFRQCLLRGESGGFDAIGRSASAVVKSVEPVRAGARSILRTGRRHRRRYRPQRSCAFIGTLLAHRACSPPASSSLAEEKSLRSLLVHGSLRSLRLALLLLLTPADERRVCSSLVKDSSTPAWLRSAARDSRRSHRD